MTSITVTANTDFRLQVLNDVTDITYLTAGAVTATFGSTQFDNVIIKNDVLWTGSGNPDFVMVIGGGVDASAWQFANWLTSDLITMNGSAANDAFVGSRMRDIINGLGGNDTIVSGHASQGDQFNGGSGNDTFRYLDFTSPITDTINGGGGLLDKITVSTGALYDFTDANILNVERLNFGADFQTILINAAELGAGAILTIGGGANTHSLRLLNANSVDLSAVTFVNWSADDEVRIFGTSATDTIIGTSVNDDIEGAEGPDTLQGRGGNDDFIYSFGTTSTIDGGSGTDAIVVWASDTFVKSMSGASISRVEQMRFDARGTSDSVMVDFDAGQVAGAGLINAVTGSIRNDFFKVSVNGADTSADLRLVTFSNWDQATDLIAMVGTNETDDTLIGNELKTSFTLTGGADQVAGGDGGNTFFVTEEITVAGFNWTSGTGLDSLQLGDVISTILDFTDGVIDGIEILDFGNSGATVQIDADSIGGATGFQTLRGGGSTFVNAINFIGQTGDMSGVVLEDWGTFDFFNMFGTALADTLTGSTGSDTFWGTELGDDLDGAGGNDTVNYINSTFAVIVSLATGNGAGGFAAGDTLSNIENITGSMNDDTLTGGLGANKLSGLDGNDIINGRQGADVLTGGAGDDTFVYNNATFSPPGVGRDRSPTSRRRSATTT